MAAAADTRTLRLGCAPILLVGDRSEELMSVAHALETLADVRVISGREAPSVLPSFDPDVIVADAGEDGGVAALTEAASLRPDAVRVLLAAPNEIPDEPIAATAVLAKPVDTDVLKMMCGLALRCAAAERTGRELGSENNRLRGIDPDAASIALDQLGDLDNYEGILTRSPSMKHVVGLLQKIEGSETTVLIHGETGTGKELVAQAIHARSRRCKKRFVAVNLGAISDHLRESELFGHVRGAFTGATDTRAGLFMEANGGCIFLDEVGDASPGLQVALLRVLEEGTMTPVGSDRPRPVDVRIISGTNRDLESLVRQGTFRRDLYYRLHVFPVELPPLGERAEDIFPLANHFLALASVAMGKKPPGISRDARAVLESYHWEGNVRELRNVMERAAILCKGGLVIAADLPMASQKTVNGNIAGAAATIAIPPGGATLEHLEREIFIKTLALTGGNQRRAARLLGLRESTFRFRMRRLDIVCRRAREEGAQPAAKSQRVANA